MSDPKRIIVRAPNWIGDQILAYPFFYYLRKIYPKSTIAVLSVPWVKSIQFCKQVDEIIELPQPEDSSLLSKFEALELAAKRVKDAGPWDLGICLPNSFSAAWIFFRAGVLRRRGYKADGRSWLLNECADWKKGIERHRSEAYTDLLFEKKSLETLRFWGEPAEDELDPALPGVIQSEGKVFDLAGEWPGERISPPETPYWILAPGTTAESRRWPVYSFQQIARKMADQTSWRGLILGGPKEKEVAEILTSDPTLRLEDWTGKGPVSSYWPVFQKAQFTLSNDSGLAHVAAFCGSSVQVVWGAGNPHRTRPIGPGRAQVILNPVPCWPCERNICAQPEGARLQCIQGLDPELVWKEILSGLGK
ncbi:MAG: glycosyltransferase family 9 protein [Bdellovibrio sp.]|nr:glycosyltransferase family 9 protein [Bdellovibrio sp.]